METIVIFVVLVLACLGAWLALSFARYRRYFRQVNAVMGNQLDCLPIEVLLRVDDVVRHAYWENRPVAETAAQAINETLRIMGKPLVPQSH